MGTFKGYVQGYILLWNYYSHSFVSWKTLIILKSGLTENCWGQDIPCRCCKACFTYRFYRMLVIKIAHVCVYHVKVQHSFKIIFRRLCTYVSCNYISTLLTHLSFRRRTSPNFIKKKSRLFLAYGIVRKDIDFHRYTGLLQQRDIHIIQ